MPLVVPGVQTSLTGNEKTDWKSRLVGKTLTDSTSNEVSFAKKDLPPKHRVVQPDSKVTRDYIEDRLNVHVDENGTVRDVNFG